MKLALQFLMLPALLFTASATLSGPHIHKEAYYRDLWCQVNHGDTEQRQPNGTIADCVTGFYAVEVEFAEKWQEAIGQSLNYSEQTGLLPGILLILETDADLKCWLRLRTLIDALDKKGVFIQLWRIGPDEIGHPQNPPTGATNSLKIDDLRQANNAGYAPQNATRVATQRQNGLEPKY